MYFYEIVNNFEIKLTSCQKNTHITKIEFTEYQHNKLMKKYILYSFSLFTFYSCQSQKAVTENKLPCDKNATAETVKLYQNLFKLLAAPKEGLLDKLKLLPKLGQFASWMPKVKSGRGECQEVVMTEPDITKLPVITCWPKDGGPFVTLPINL